MIDFFQNSVYFFGNIDGMVCCARCIEQDQTGGINRKGCQIKEMCIRDSAIGLYVKRGKYGGTYAHKDIAFEFASAISPVFKLYLIKEFQ